MRDDFCLFIQTHGRPNNIPTLKSLEKAGYTGKYYLVIDNEDEVSKEYYKNYGDKVIMFNKEEIGKTFDIGDNKDSVVDRKTITFARNACFEIAKDLGITYFMELDDDYTRFEYVFNKKGEFKHIQIEDLDKVLEAAVKFYIDSGADCVAFAQGGDFIGGKNGMGKNIKIKRKAMNT